MSKYGPWQRDPLPGDTVLGIFVGILIIGILVICLVCALADAIDRTPLPTHSLTDTQRRVVVDRWGEPQLTEGRK